MLLENTLKAHSYKYLETNFVRDWRLLAWRVTWLENIRM